MSATIIAVMLSGICTGEVIMRKDGRKIEGQIVRETDQYLEVETAIGIFRIDKNDIASVSGRRAISQSEREGREALAAGDLDRALERFQAALQEVTKAEDKKALEQMIRQVRQAIQKREEERFSSQLQTARRLIAEKRFADALAELERLLKQNPEPSPAAKVIRREIGNLYMAEAAYYKDQINYSEAADAYQKAIEMLPNDPRPYFEMARLLQRRGGKVDEIISYYEKGLQLARNSMKVTDLLDEYYELGKAYLRAGKGKEPNKRYLMEGIKNLLIVARDGATSYPFATNQLEDGFVELGKAEISATEMSEIIGALKSTLDINPQAQRVRWILAELYVKRKEFDKAIAEMKIIEQRSKETGEPLPTEFYYRMGLAYLSLPKPDYDAALEAFENEIRQNKLNYMALIHAAQLHSANGTYDDAFAYCNRAISLRPERPEAYWVAGDAYVRRSMPGDFQQARAYLHRALSLKPDFHKARIKLAQIEIMQQLKTTDPDFSQAETMLMQVLANLKNIDKAKITEDDIRVKAEAMLWLAEIANSRRHPHEALNILKQVLIEYPNFPKAYRVKGQVHVALEEYDKAKQSYLKAIELDPRQADTYYLLGVLCQNYLKSYKEAIKYYREYLRHGGSEIERVTRWINECTRAAATAAESPPASKPTEPDTASTVTAEAATP